MKIISNILIAIVMQLGYSCVAQKTESYHFVVKDKVIIDTSSGLYLHSEFEFTYRRVFLPDSSFKEVGLFTREKDKRDASHFKIKGDRWYIKNKNKWELFYALGKQVTPNVQIAGRWYSFEATKAIEIKGNSCIIYKAKLKKGQSGGEMYYCFTPRKGVIMLKSDDVELIREDMLINEPTRW